MVDGTLNLLIYVVLQENLLRSRYFNTPSHIPIAAKYSRGYFQNGVFLGTVLLAHLQCLKYPIREGVST